MTNRPLWSIRRRWTEADETDYAAWIEQNAAVDMLKGSGLALDCADFAIALRWIYARAHHLPAANSLAASGELWGSWQSTSIWDRLPTATDWKHDERFKAALRFVLDGTYTHTLFEDLYPVAIQRRYVTGGTIFLTLWASDSGHTRTIYKVGSGAACPNGNPCM